MTLVVQSTSKKAPPGFVEKKPEDEHPSYAQQYSASLTAAQATNKAMYPQTHREAGHAHIKAAVSWEGSQAMDEESPDTGFAQRLIDLHREAGEAHIAAANDDAGGVMSTKAQELSDEVERHLTEGHGSGKRYDTSPIGTGKNWVTKADPKEGLGSFIRAVAHALIRQGHSKSEAIAIAVAAVKKWSAGHTTGGEKGKPSAATMAKAADAVSHWNSIKSASHRSDEEVFDYLEELEERAVGAYAPGHAFFGNQWVGNPNTGANMPQLPGGLSWTTGGSNPNGPGQNIQVTGATAPPKKGGGKGRKGGGGGGGGSAAAAQSKAQAAARHQAAIDAAANSAISSGSTTTAQNYNSLSAADRAALSQGVPPAGYAWQKGTDGTMTLVATAAGQQKASQIATNAQIGADWKAAGKAIATSQAQKAAGQNQAAIADSRLASQEAAAKSAPASSSSSHSAMSVNLMSSDDRKSFKSSHPVPPPGYTWGGDPTAPTLVPSHRAEPSISIRAISEWSSAGPGSSSFMGMGQTDSSGAGLLLPPGPIKKPKPQEATTIGPHRFMGTDLQKCAGCGQPITASVHSRKARGTTSGNRSDDNGDIQEATILPFVPKSLAGHHKAAKARSLSNIARVENALQTTMEAHFAAQRASTISRLMGKRGRQAIRKATESRADPDGGTPADGAPEVPPEPSGGYLDPTAVFDPGYWTSELASDLGSEFAKAGTMATSSASHALGLPLDFDDGSSLGAVDTVLAQRAQDSAMKITGTTRQQIFTALQTGIAQGESIQQMADSINAIFDHADSVRAKTIAQTEGIGALNQAANVYARALPPDVVGGKMWLAHHDTRTRPAHRLADGQVQQIDQPFWVGGFAMQHPGDPSAPPDLVINCRCDTAMLPPHLTDGVFEPTKLEGLVPASTLEGLKQVQNEQQANRDKLVAAQAAAAQGS